METKIVVVTGASRGIGRAIALAFAEEGANLVLAARDRALLERVEAEINAMGRKSLVVPTNVAKDNDVAGLAETTMRTFGRVDVLVNNAGMAGVDVPVWSMTVEHWDELMGVNLRGAFLCSRAMLPCMMERKQGFIINIASEVGRLAAGTYGAYSTSKWGLLGYTASLADSVRPYGIRVNAINPGWVNTDMARDDPRFEDVEDMSTPEEIARVALFLVKSAPLDMSGQAIDIFPHP